MAIEIDRKPELEGPRDLAITTRLVMKAIDAEKTSAIMHADPTIPVSMVEDIDWEINLLNHFIPLAIQRSKRWGIEEQVKQEVRLIDVIREGLANG